MSTYRRIRPAVALLLAVATILPSLASAESKLLIPGSPERRELCFTFASSFATSYQSYESGVSADLQLKQWAIHTAGSGLDESLSALIRVSILIAHSYYQAGRSEEELVTDVLYNCVPNSLPIFDAIELWLETDPVFAGLRAKAQEGNSVPSGSFLEPTQYAELLGDDFAGTHSLVFHDRKMDGKLMSCGLDFSHTLYDFQHQQGQPVKISGSMILTLNSSTGLAAIVKFKAENLIVTMNLPDPLVDLQPITIATKYVVSDGKPLLENIRNFECEADGWECQVIFDWDEFVVATISNTFGLAYRPENGLSDVEVRLDLRRTAEQAREYEAYSTCTSNLLSLAQAN